MLDQRLPQALEKTWMHVREYKLEHHAPDTPVEERISMRDIELDMLVRWQGSFCSGTVPVLSALTLKRS